MKPTLLLVDDDKVTRIRVAGLIESRGYKVHQCGRLSEARTVMAAEKVDLVILDGLLPDGTGIDFVRELRAAGQKSKVMFLSAFFKDAKSHAALTRELHVAAVLHKPLTAPELFNGITTALEATVP